MSSLIALLIVFVGVKTLQSTDYAVEMYDIISIGAGSVIYYLFNLMKLMFLKKKLDMDEIIMTAIVVFLVGVGQKIINAMVYPDADANNDGLVTRKAFEDWKRRMDTKNENSFEHE